MPLAYDPQHAVAWVPKPGVYNFRVVACTEAKFSTGSRGIRLQLDVDAGGKAPVSCRDHVVFGEHSTWKMLALCQATGVRFDPPCEARDLIHTTGRAEFTTEEFQVYIDLKVVRYLPRDGDKSRA